MATTEPMLVKSQFSIKSSRMNSELGFITSQLNGIKKFQQPNSDLSSEKHHRENSSDAILAAGFPDLFFNAISRYESVLPDVMLRIPLSSMLRMQILPLWYLKV
ncbi:unnamed protein product [Fraxinus pennsylvanica]|uniref:Uncharacterized protein n=1 Tax=Fraxinus pennsylvanica TaxID=56036 RepID=A0AAD2EFV6_9LAMI|nr:unnamed protein product [Fraxinus pennsylvanica]